MDRNDGCVRQPTSWMVDATRGQPGKLKLRQALGLCLVLILAAGWSNALRPPVLPARAVPAVTYPWLYLRQGQALREDEDLVSVIAVGDVMLGRKLAGKQTVFDGVAGMLAQADLVIGNLEGVLEADSGSAWSATQLPDSPFSACNPLSASINSRIVSNSSQPIYLVMPMSAAGLLQSAGFDMLGLANNHALDDGASGLIRTASLLHRMGMEVAGMGSTPEGAFQPALRQIKGLRVAVLAFTAIPPLPAPGEPVYVADWQWQRMLAAVRFAHSHNDIVIVLVHWGTEYDTLASSRQRDAAYTLVMAGANLVVGAHPHVAQGTEVIIPKDDLSLGWGRANTVGFAAYSLGNFVFDQYDDLARQGLALRTFFDQQGLRAVQAIPLRSDGSARLLLPGEAQGELKRIQPPAKGLRFGCDQQSCQVVAQVSASGDLSGWQADSLVDLTGDGQPEWVRKVGMRIEIYQDKRLMWSSPPEWQVLDMATGDPNDDGRYEIILAVQKPGVTGKPASHPFIVGYRGGEYRLLWGGSAVSEEIDELNLGDVDGDGVQELVVIERQESGRQTLAVWRWHGWGFSLVWRSRAAWFENLRLTPEDGKVWLEVDSR